MTIAPHPKRNAYPHRPQRLNNRKLSSKYPQQNLNATYRGGQDPDPGTRSSGVSILEAHQVGLI